MTDVDVEQKTVFRDGGWKMKVVNLIELLNWISGVLSIAFLTGS